MAMELHGGRSPLSTLTTMVLVVAIGAASCAVIRAGSTRPLAQDTFGYLQMSRAIGSGGEEMVGFRRVGCDPAAAVVDTTWPVGYSVMVLAGTWAGLAPAESATVVPLISLLVSAVLLGAVCLRAFGPVTAVVAPALLCWSGAVMYVAGRALSEMPAIGVALASIALLHSAEWAAGEGRRRWLAAAAGVCAGLAVWTRYAMLGFVAGAGVGVAAAWILSPGHRRLAVHWMAAAAATVGVLLAGNLAVSGHLFGEYRFPATEGVVKNLATMCNHVVGSVAGVYGSRSNPWSLAAGAALLVLLAAAGGVVVTARTASRGALWRLATAGALAVYPLFIVATRSLSSFDPIDARFLAPFVALFVAGVVAPASGIVLEPRRDGRDGGGDRGPGRWARAGAVVVLALFAGGQARLAGWRGGADSGFGMDAAETAGRIAAGLDPGAVLVTNSMPLAYAWTPNQVFIADERGALTEAWAREVVRGGRGVCFHLGYDHPEFDAALIGPLAAALFRGEAPLGARLVMDDGRSRVWAAGGGGATPPGP